MNTQLDMVSILDGFADEPNPKREFLTLLDGLIPWDRWLELVRPYYYKGERGNKPYSAELMLRMYTIQIVYNLSDMGTMYELLDSRAFAMFCGVTTAGEVPNGDTLGRFRHILTDNRLHREILVDLVEILTNNKLMLKRAAGDSQLAMAIAPKRQL